jgi:hypothetical protein
MKSQIDGTWELISGQPLPKGARDIKIISGGHFMFAAYDTKTGQPLYTAGGTFKLNGSMYTERMDFASDKINDLVGKDQSFTVEMEEDTLIQKGTLSNGEALSERFKRLS